MKRALTLAIFALPLGLSHGSTLASSDDSDARTERPVRVADISPQPEMVRPEDLPQGFIIVADDPQRIANASDPITIGTVWGGWDPSNPAFEMQPRSDSRWQLELNGKDRNGRFAFKFTRGNWDTVELSREGEQIDNRLLPEVSAAQYADGTKPIFEFTIPKWADQLPSAGLSVGVEDVSVELNVAGDARRLQLVGGAGRASAMPPRDAVVWLPEGYDHPANADKTYPVLYMMDGQNLFQAPESGDRREWLADESLTALTALNQIEPVIVVGIPHAGDFRADEYLPLPIVDGVQPAADEFVHWLEHVVLPRTERAFRVSDNPAHRYVGGASLGGIIALYTVTERPDLFAGGVLAESPSLIAGDGSLREHFLNADNWPNRVYIGMGGHETGDNNERNNAYVNAARELANQAVKHAGRENVTLLIRPQHTHNEAAWSERFPEALMSLLSKN